MTTAPDEDDEDDDIFSSTIDVSTILLSSKRGVFVLLNDYGRPSNSFYVIFKLFFFSLLIWQDLSSLRNEELYASAAMTIPPPLTNIDLKKEPNSVESDVPLNDDKEVKSFVLVVY